MTDRLPGDETFHPTLGRLLFVFRPLTFWCPKLGRTTLLDDPKNGVPRQVAINGVVKLSDRRFLVSSFKI